MKKKMYYTFKQYTFLKRKKNFPFKKGGGDQVQGAGDQVEVAGDQVQGAGDQVQGAGDQV